MDPNANLKRQRELAAEIQELQDGLAEGEQDGEVSAALEHAASELAELVEALDNWLSMGGFLPDAWQDVIARRYGIVQGDDGTYLVTDREGRVVFDGARPARFTSIHEAQAFNEASRRSDEEARR